MPISNVLVIANSVTVVMPISKWLDFALTKGGREVLPFSNIC